MAINRTIHVYGSKPIAHYSNNFLAAGLSAHNTTVVVLDPLAPIHATKPDGRIVQIHGAPQSMNAGDLVAIKNIEKLVSQPDGVPTCVLVHRPDQVIREYPEFGELLTSVKHKLVLTMLGGLFIDNDFYGRANPNIVRRIIPHGFPTLEKNFQIDPVIIGADTSWGEMRDVEDVIKLMGHVFALRREAAFAGVNIFGYLGGTTIKLDESSQDRLDLSYLGQVASELAPGQKINFIAIDNESAAATIEQFRQSPDQDVILVSKGKKPAALNLTFNTQLYYLRNSSGQREVRFGESSGSAHNVVALPVVVEVNGAEAGIESLPVIKLSYADRHDFNSLDFAGGAKQIFEAVDSGRYKSGLESFYGKVQEWNVANIGSMYLELLGDWS